ncbi:MAG: group II intron reverse transcriptase/maturase [Candidatus Riflebacteria bacterium]
MPTSLLAIANKARTSRKHRFQNLYHLLNRVNLRTCFYELKKNAAPGVDKVDWDTYETNLEENLRNLNASLRTGSYHARPIRRKYIPKGNGKQRPLGILCLEDKIVQRAVATILDAIYEQDFLDCSYGYRPKRCAKGASEDLARKLQFGPYGWVVEADIRGFFDAMDHDWLIRMLEQRIGDRKILRLIRKWLKAGILEPDLTMLHPETGTPQGGIVSPILANIYLHYALDLWFEHIVKPKCRGRVLMIRYVDDFVCAFQYHDDAAQFQQLLEGRLGKFQLSLAPEKTRSFRFNRFFVGGEKFDFLGFTFRWSKNSKGNPQVWRQTAKDRFRRSLSRLKEWLRKARNLPMKELMKTLKSKYRGHRNYYGVIGNKNLLDSFVFFANGIVFKWLNRRSQRRSYNWEGFRQAIKHYGLEEEKIEKIAA